MTQSKRIIVLLSLLFVLGSFVCMDAFAHHTRRSRNFKPRISLSVSGGLTFQSGFYDYGDYIVEESVFSQGVLGIAGHVWVHPDLSLDLEWSSHFYTDFVRGERWGYVSLKPGIRGRFDWLYLRGALNFAFTGDRGPVLFGFLVGGGTRVPLSRRLRFFTELDVHLLFGGNMGLPVELKSGIEVMF